MFEHRLFSRFRASGEVLFQFNSPQPETIKAELVDISFRGFGVYSEKAISAMTEVKFYISGKLFKKHLRGQGKVMYSQQYRRKETDLFRMGVEFISVDSEQVRDVLELLRQEQPGSVVPEEK